MNRFAARRLGFVLLTMAPVGLSGCRSSCPCVEQVSPCCTGPIEATASVGASAVGQVNVLVEVAVFHVAASVTAAEIGISTAADRAPYAVMSKEKADELGARWAKTKGIELLQMPSIVTKNGQEATIVIGESIAPGSTPAAEKLSFSVEYPDWTGTRAVLRPTYDGTTVTMEVSIARRDTGPKDHAPDLSAIRASEIGVRARDVKMRNGETVVITYAPGAQPEAGRLIAVVRSTILHESDVVSRPVTPARRTADGRW